MAVKAQIAAVAEQVCGEFSRKAHPSRTIRIGGRPFESTDGADGKGRCQEFVRECCQAAAPELRTKNWWGGSAAASERMLQRARRRTRKPQRGDLAYTDCGIYGHVIVLLGGGRYAENTGGGRGPGYHIGRLTDFAGRALRYYEIIANTAKRPRIILPDGRECDCQAEVRSDGRTWVQLQPLWTGLERGIDASEFPDAIKLQ